MVHHCQRADFKESSKLLRVANRNQASQPYETFCTLTRQSSRHPNTPLGPKRPKRPTQEPPQKSSLSENAMKEDERVLFQPFHAKGNRRGLRCEDFETSADILAQVYSFRDTAIFVKRVCQIKITMQLQWGILGLYSMHRNALW